MYVTTLLSCKMPGQQQLLSLHPLVFDNLSWKYVYFIFINTVVNEVEKLWASCGVAREQDLWGESLAQCLS